MIKNTMPEVSIYSNFKISQKDISYKFYYLQHIAGKGSTNFNQKPMYQMTFKPIICRLLPVICCI